MGITISRAALSLIAVATVVVSAVRFCVAKERKEQTTMKFGYTILYVNDVEATLQFYERAFGFKRKMLDEGKQYGELETGGTTLAFAANGFVRSHMPVKFEEAGPTKSAPPIELGMVTQDVENSFRQAVAAGAVEVKKPEKKPWGQTVVTSATSMDFLSRYAPQSHEHRVSGVVRRKAKKSSRGRRTDSVDYTGHRSVAGYRPLLAGNSEG